MRAFRLRGKSATVKRRSKIASVLTAGVVGLVVGFPVPAQASVGDQAAWSALPQLEQNLYWNSNLVKFWQLIVQSDVTTGETCEQFVDGQFGPNTKTRTKNWQSLFTIGVDGEVGPQTWSTAQSHLQLKRTDYWDTVRNGFGEKRWSWYYDYVGKRSSFYLAYSQVDHYAYGYYSYTSYEPWEFQACGQPYWIYLTW